MRVLVVGGTRFIGRALVLRLGTLGHQVAVLNRGRTEDDLPADVRRITGDREALMDVRGEIADFAPDVAIHNVVSCARHVEQFLQALAGQTRRLVVTSSMDVYRVYGRGHGIEGGAPDHTLQREDAPLRTVLYPYRKDAADESDMRWHYDKIPAERELLEAPDVDPLVLRLPMVLGPRDPANRLAPFAAPMRAGRSTIVLQTAYAEWKSTYGFIENVVDAMARTSLSQTPNTVYNVGDWVLSIRELIERVGQLEGWDGHLVTAPRDALPEALREDWHVEHWLACDSQRVRDDLGWQPSVTLREALRTTLDWEPAQASEDMRDRWAAEDAYLTGTSDVS